ncbi:cell division protein FtsK [Arachidicoccus ginsenosidimutans]|uniref:DNA translocase FtsK n=1 Tax=Arachidicoccus sp. BS20 TaxID=1850526 RepID=UPI0007F15D2D|nr:DNA translocase FtsK [Arachidicoccus sp. BS20]ANI89287.1 cell division protein FtsK [Arachidicoccus sp. BS20]
MANKLKTTKKTIPSPDKLNDEQDVKVSVSEIVKDERTYKITGVILLLICFFLFISFASYLFTWQDDQDKVMNFGVKIFSTKDVKVSNLFGVLGAYVSHNLIYNGFGIASFLLCTIFFVAGVNFLFGKKIYSLKRNLKYVVTGLLVISVAFALINTEIFKSGFSWGGAVGELMYEWLKKWIGVLGAACIVLVIVGIYLIWRFDPEFSLAIFKKKAKSVFLPVEENETEEEIHEDEADEQEENQDAKLFIQEPANQLKGKGTNVSVIMPKLPEEKDDEGLSLNEKDEDALPAAEEEKIIAPKATIVVKPKPASLDEPMKLEITPDIEEVPSEIIVNPSAPEAKAKAQGNYEPSLDLSNYQYPSIDLLEQHGTEKTVHDPDELEQNKNQIIATLKNYDILIQRISATVGPTVTLYEIVPAPGVRISRIKNLEDDIALSLAALGIRIIAPIPGKGTIGIEVPNINKTIVSMRSMLASDKFQNNNFSLPIAIGKKINNENFIVDLASMPHLLMAGATGQGKSVGVNALLVSLLYKKHPSQLKFVLVDPKKVELSLYKTIEHHFLAKLPNEEDAIITDTKKVVTTLNALCIEMDNRYDLLKEAGCRNIKEYNEKFVNRRLNPQKGHQFLPFIVLVVDEFADLIMTAGKEIEMPIARLAQLARAVGIHLIIATQRPSVNIITGTIKANFPARIAFKVSSKIDSRTILDAGGAEQLIGKGDMLISYNGEITRLQCAFVDTPEVDKVCDFIGYQDGYPQAFLLPEYVDEKELESGGNSNDLSDRDPLFEDAARLIVQNQIGSTSLIQRRMKLGYNRAGRLMDQLETAGVVGANQGSKARDVLIKTDAELQELLDNLP